MKNAGWIFLVMFAISASALVAGCQCSDDATLSGDEPKPTFDQAGPQPCLKQDASDLTPCATGVIDFGKVPVKTSVQREITIGNVGTAPLEFKDFTITYLGGPNKGAFQEGSRPATIDPSKTGKYVMAYTPGTVGKDSGTLRVEVYINKLADKTEIYDFSLAGQGVQAAIDVCVLDDTGAETKCQSQCDKDPQTGKPTDCLQVAFGEVNLATMKDPVLKKVKVKNGGGLALTVHSTPVLQCPVTNPTCQVGDMVSSTEYSVTDPKTGTPPAPGLNEISMNAVTEQVLTVAYKPYDGGQDSGVLKVLSEDLVSPEINVYLGGSGKAPKICPEPVTVDFGSVNVGSSKQMTVKLKSCGTDPLDLKGVTLVNSPSSWYSLDSLTPNAPITLQPGEEVDAQVSCKPDKVASETGQLNVVTNDPSLKDGTGYIRLLCQGREPPACKIKADPSTLDYGKMAASKTASKDFYVLNVGEDVCTVTAMNGPTNSVYKLTGMADDTGKAISGTPFTIDPTKRVKVTVQFTAPTDKTCPADKITVVNSSVNAPSLDVTLTGCGGESPLCKFQVSPVGTLNFGNVAKGAKKTMSINFNNIGTSDCDITSSKFGSMTGDWYSFAKSNSYPIVVQAGSSAKMEIVCSPKGTGPATDKMGIPDTFGENVVNTGTTDPAQPKAGTMCTANGWCHKLLCTGVLSKLDVLPDPIDFGLVTIGCNSQEVVVKLYNNGTATLNVTKLEVVPASTPAVFIISSAPPLPFSIGANSSVQVKLKYHPSKSGIETAVFRISTDAPNANNGVIDVPMTGEGTTDSAVKDVFKQTDKPTVDVLWCVDNSGSMSDDQSGMSSNFPTFINYAVSLNIDYQLGVVTTEINDSGKGDTGDMIYPGVLFQRAGEPRIITNSNPHPTTPPYTPTNVDPIKAFEANAMPGTCCSDAQESCMEAVHMALSDPLINDDQANKGFLRKYAKLVIIMMSDEDDQSPGTVDYYVDFLKQLKGPRNKDLLSVSMICAFDRDGDVKNPPNAQACASGSSSSGSAGVRYLDMFKKIGDGLALTICQSNWGTTMQKLGLDAFVAIIEYFLSRQADPSTIVVKVNGNAVPNDPVNGYSYDPNTNSVVFGSGAVPPKGATIEVSYSAQCY